MSEIINVVKDILNGSLSLAEVPGFVLSTTTGLSR